MLPFILAILLGVASVFGYAPWGWYALPVLSLAALFYLLREATTARAGLRLGFAYGLGLFGFGVSWVHVSLHQFGGMPLALAWLAVALFAAFLALFPALALAVGVRLFRPGARWLALPACWVLLEGLRGVILTGFPWLALGYSQVPESPLAGYAPVLGVYGVSLLAALSAGILAMPRWRGALWLMLIWGTGFGLQKIEWTTPFGSPVSVSLLQGNVAQDMKFRPEHLRQTLKDYLEMAKAAQGSLKILPETALPVLLSEVPPSYLRALQQTAPTVLVGVPEAEGGAYFNSLVQLGQTPVQRYRKRHLVPFGEFTPPGFDGVMSLLSIPFADFGRGPAQQPPFAIAGQRIAANICYEDVFGEALITDARGATLMVNVSNDAWFGHSAAPWQHLQIAQMRALETGRWQLRANNTGITAVLNERGRIEVQLPPFQPGVLEAEAQGRSGLTPYLRWGNGPAWGLAGLLLILAWVQSRPSQRHGRRT